jgi:protein associated with RNAse G/E
MLQEADVYKMLVSGEQWGMWRGYQCPLSDDYVTIWTPIGTPMHWKPGTWIRDKHCLSYFWANAWYTIHASYFADGRLSGCYCDMVLPTESYSSEARRLSYIDLYLDVVVREDHTVYTKDQQVFEWAALRYSAVRKAREQVYAEMDRLEAQARQWSGPFALIPTRLPRTDWEQHSPAEVGSLLFPSAS